MKKILITGSNGQLGSDCLNFYSSIGEVLGLDLPFADLTNQKELNNYLNTFKPNIIINCAAYTNVDKCESDPLCWRVNEDIPNYLSQWSSKNNALLVHISTDYVFDGNKERNEYWIEDELPNPLSEYGKSKFAGEQIIQNNMDNFIILRTAWLYGKNGKNFLKSILEISKNNEQPIKIVDDQFGSPTWSLKLAQQIRSIINTDLRGIFHASSMGSCSWYDLANEFFSLLNREVSIIPCSTEEFPALAPRPRNSILKNSRLIYEDINCFVHWKLELKEFIAKNKDFLL